MTADNLIGTGWTVEEFFAYEEREIDKHEYINGNVYRFIPINITHAQIASHVMANIGNQIRDTDCYGLSSRMRIQISPTIYVWADFSVVCGKGEFADEETRLLLNPTLTCEVYSPQTENYDRGQKSQFYRSLPSLQHYLLVDQSRVHIELFTRHKEGWLLKEFNQRDEIVPLDAIGMELPLNDIYRAIELDDKS